MQMLRSSLKIGTSDITPIDSQETFWDFFDVLVDKLFRTEWYNGKVRVYTDLRALCHNLMSADLNY